MLLGIFNLDDCLLLLNSVLAVYILNYQSLLSHDHIQEFHLGWGQIITARPIELQARSLGSNLSCLGFIGL
jgi:hypothetical protein